MHSVIFIDLSPLTIDNYEEITLKTSFKREKRDFFK